MYAACDSQGCGKCRKGIWNTRDLIHGARAVLRHIQRRIKIGQASGNAWVEQCLQRMHINKVIVALANKMARMAWAVLAHQQDYRAA